MSSEGFPETLFFRPMQIKLNFSTNAAEIHRVDLSFLFCHQNVTFKTTFPSGWGLVGVNLESGPVCAGPEHIGDPLSFVRSGHSRCPSGGGAGGAEHLPTAHAPDKCFSPLEISLCLDVFGSCGTLLGSHLFPA